VVSEIRGGRLQFCILVPGCGRFLVTVLRLSLCVQSGSCFFVSGCGGKNERFVRLLSRYNVGLRFWGGRGGGASAGKF
jgi:hypothetical protein